MFGGACCLLALWVVRSAPRVRSHAVRMQACSVLSCLEMCFLWSLAVVLWAAMASYVTASACAPQTPPDNTYFVRSAFDSGAWRVVPD